MSTVWRRIVADTLDIDAKTSLAIVFVSLVALLAGAIVVGLTIDVPGDGPTHATLAFLWSRHPKIAKCGNWLPGFTYLAGIFLIAIPKPLLVPRLCNLTLSTATIAPFYLLVRRIYGSRAALLATVGLVALPMRIGLGATSMTEPSFLFFFVAAILCLTIALEGGSIRFGPLCAALIFFDLAELTRYEMWALMPLVVLYLCAQTRRLKVAAFAVFAVSIFPLAWSLGNYLQFRDFFYPFTRVSHPIEGGSPMGVGAAIAQLADMVPAQLGWLLSIAALAGLILELYRAARRQTDWPRRAFAILVVVVWAMNFRAAMKLGPGFYSRYLLVGLTLAMPFAALGFIELFGDSRGALALGVLAIAISFSEAVFRQTPDMYVTRRRPAGIIDLVRWLPNSPYRNDAVMLTKMNWQSTYLPLHAPDLIDRFFIASVWSDDARMLRFLEDARPAILITRPNDAGDREHIERILGRSLGTARESPVFIAHGDIEVYDISSATREQQRAAH